jgi:methionyl-tRNA formyltransferase
MKIVIAATPKIAFPSIFTLQKAGYQIQIVTQPDRAAGRGLSLRQTEISKEFPEALKPEDEQGLQGILSDSDLLVTIGYGRILSLATLNIPKFGGVNLHFSLLPKWRGAAPVQRALEAGDHTTGVTIFQMDSGVDTGDIWVQENFEIPKEYSSIELFEALAQLGSKSLLRSIELIEGGAKPRPQSGEPTIARKVAKSETIINWQEPAETIIRKIRAFASNPMARTSIRGKVLKIASARVNNTAISSLAPGELSNDGLVGTAKGEVQLLTVIPSGKKAMNCKDWLNGFRPIPGESFE